MSVPSAGDPALKRGMTQSNQRRLRYNNRPAAPSKAAYSPMKHDFRDLALRTLFLTAGGLAALLLALEGYGTALPAVAFGGALGALFVAGTQTSEE